MKDIANKEIERDFDIWSLYSEWGGYGKGYGNRYNRYDGNNGDGYENGNGESRKK
jgi:hypothetical protein